MKLILVGLILFAAHLSLAGPALSYNCNGIFQIGSEPTGNITFSVDYSEWTQGVGYATEMLFVTQPDEFYIDLKELRTNVEKYPDCANLDELNPVNHGSNFNYNNFNYNFSCGPDTNTHALITAYCYLN